MTAFKGFAVHVSRNDPAQSCAGIYMPHLRGGSIREEGYNYMRVSKRFPTAVHVLLYVAVAPPGHRVTSTIVAESTGTNAVIIRNLFLDLSKSGLLTASAGKNGGVRLAREPKDITLWDIYQAVETNDVEEIFKLHKTDSTCPVAKNIYQVLYPHVFDAVNAMKDSMEQVTLEALLNELICQLKTDLKGSDVAERISCSVEPQENSKSDD